ncbi:hypothetical protein C8J57DRAFT_1525101 [Mycena rebaudengoi]|nr:hypothetical protein C8J57DRAFT_1525101 [Mycena rebaudengoi]
MRPVLYVHPPIVHSVVEHLRLRVNGWDLENLTTTPCCTCSIGCAPTAPSEHQPDVDLPPRPSTCHQRAVSALASTAISARRSSPHCTCPVGCAPRHLPWRHLPYSSLMWTYLHAHQRAVNAPSASLQAPLSVPTAPPRHSPLHVLRRLRPTASALAASSVQQPDVDLPPRPSTRHQCAVSKLASTTVSACGASPPLPIARAPSAVPHGICTGSFFGTAARCGLTSMPINAPSTRRQQACKRRRQCPPRLPAAPHHTCSVGCAPRHLPWWHLPNINLTRTYLHTHQRAINALQAPDRCPPRLPTHPITLAAPHGIYPGGIFRRSARYGLTSVPINAPSSRHHRACKRCHRCPPHHPPAAPLNMCPPELRHPHVTAPSLELRVPAPAVFPTIPLSRPLLAQLIGAYVVAYPAIDAPMPTIVDASGLAGVVHLYPATGVHRPAPLDHSC